MSSASQNTGLKHTILDECSTMWVPSLPPFLPPSCRSVGSTVVEMLTCHPPWYDVREPTAAMFKIAMEETCPNLPPHCSEHVKHFLALCFVK